VGGVADEQRLAGLSHAPRDAPPHLHREQLGEGVGIRARQVAAERDGDEVVAVADEDAAVVVVDQEPELVGDREADLGDVVELKTISRDDVYQAVYSAKITAYKK
jgi:hypothetical protein